MFGEDGVKLVRDMQGGIHFSAGISCHDCHGGNPDPALGEDMDSAMDASFRANPYKGRPERTAIPAFCGNCHSDPQYMRRFDPDTRVDIEAEYWTSQHGQALKRGDAAVATCVDCHGVHGILQVTNQSAPVYPANAAATCAKCHSDPERMAGRKTPDGRSIPVNQFALWRASVHGKAVMEKGDMFAPTCNDCHGNHGATPPGVESISFVCGQCHGREAELFRKSEKHAGFQRHKEYVAEMGAGECQVCHEMPQDFEKGGAVISLSECTSCHGNHGVRRPTVAMFSPLPETPCAFCHEPIESEGEVPLPVETNTYAEVLSESLAEAASLGLESEDRFDWMVDKTLHLEAHLELGGEPGQRRLKSAFERLFQKLRIGATTYTYVDDVTGLETKGSVIRCGHCHMPGSEDDGVSTPAGVARLYVSKMHQLGALTADSERMLLRARRGGVETREALSAIEEAVDSSIELQALVHSFSTDDEGPFLEKHKEGMEFAQHALEAAVTAQEELNTRRMGLGVSLVFILLVLAALGLKIRQLG